MKKLKSFYLTVSLPSEQLKPYEQEAKERGVTLNRHIANLVEGHGEAVKRAEDAEAKIAETQAAALHFVKNSNRLLGIMFRALRETMPSVRQEKFDVLWHNMASAQPGEEYDHARNMVAQFVQIPTERPVEMPQPDYMN